MLKIFDTPYLVNHLQHSHLLNGTVLLHDLIYLSITSGSMQLRERVDQLSIVDCQRLPTAVVHSQIIVINMIIKNIAK